MKQNIGMTLFPGYHPYQDSIERQLGKSNT